MRLVATIVLPVLGAGCMTASQSARHPGLAAAQLPAIVPAWEMIEGEFKNRAGYSLSPDGGKLAWTAIELGYSTLHVQAIERGPVTVIPGDHFAITAYRWAADSRHILIDQDEDGAENDHILVADVERPDQALVDATPAPGSRSIVDFVPAKAPGMVFIRSNERNPRLFDLYALDLVSGRKTLVAQNDGAISSWVIDDFGRLYGRWRGLQFERRDVASGAWRGSFALDSGDTLLLIGAPDANGRVWARSNRHRDLIVLVRVDLASGAEEEIYADPAADIADAVIEPDGQAPLLAESWPDYQRLKVFAGPLGETLAGLAAERGSIVSVTSIDRVQRNLIVARQSEDGRSEFYLLDRASRTLKLLARNERTAWQGRISPTEPIAVTARDGLVLHGFLTLPLGATGKRLPMVLLVHGGPWAQDRWGFDRWTQFLANRGYAVLRVNYRGSTGYGRAFEQAAKREFGGKMHQDLVDAVAWAVARGVADPAAIGIMGASYGGYAVLVGLTATPDLFAAGIEMNGISDLVAFSEHLPPYWSPWRWRAYVGDPTKTADRGAMIDKSPLSHVGSIKRPLLAFQSRNDVRVTRDQLDRLAAAMRAAGKPIETVDFPDAGHSPHWAEDNYRFFRDSERFLATHLGGRVGP